MCGRGYKKLYRLYLGRTPYKSTWDIQKKLVDKRRAGSIPDCLILTEHDPVITMGRGTDRQNLLADPATLEAKGVELYEIERGGDITFHGPGQLVAYPIIDLTVRGRDVHKYLRDLEHLMIETLMDLGLKAGIKKGLTGVWVDDHKVGAIGVAVSKWVTYHGLALNVNTDLDYYKMINPCGITRYPVGSASQLLGQQLSLNHVAEILAANFADMFGYEMESMADIDGLIEPAQHSSP
jgi:lipoate-protein ligase B